MNCIILVLVYWYLAGLSIFWCIMEVIGIYWSKSVKSCDFQLFTPLFGYFSGIFNWNMTVDRMICIFLVLVYWYLAGHSIFSCIIEVIGIYWLKSVKSGNFQLFHPPFWLFLWYFRMKLDCKYKELYQFWSYFTDIKLAKEYSDV